MGFFGHYHRLFLDAATGGPGETSITSISRDVLDIAIEQTYSIDPYEWQEFLRVLRGSRLKNIEFTCFREPHPYFPKEDMRSLFPFANIQISAEHSSQEDVYDARRRLADSLQKIQPERESAVYVSGLLDDQLTNTPELVYVFEQAADERNFRSYAKITLKPAEQF